MKSKIAVLLSFLITASAFADENLNKEIECNITKKPNLTQLASVEFQSGTDISIMVRKDGSVLLPKEIENIKLTDRKNAGGVLIHMASDGITIAIDASQLQQKAGKNVLQGIATASGSEDSAVALSSNLLNLNVFCAVKE